ncbi:MAG TPA: helix-turn-helix transcriptional regulator [Opitutaceae bacterium]|nr:helix-turn-helix transcriptional regulator [Opitutaceae bacterium]
MPKRTPISAHDAALKRSFGVAVRGYRRRLGISQEEFAWRADMHRTYLADVERGVRNLSLSSIARVVGAIGVPLSEFFQSVEQISALHPPASSHRSKAGDTDQPLRKRVTADGHGRRRSA